MNDKENTAATAGPSGSKNEPDAEREERFEELQDAAPQAKFRFSWPGKIGVAIVTFWILVAVLGPFLVPYGENDLPYPDDYSEFQSVREHAWLGTDIDDRDVLTRVVYGASRTMGMSFAATIIAYIVGVTLGIAAAVSGGWIDSLLSRINDAFLSLPTIMLGLVVIAAIGSSIPILIITAGLIFAAGVFRISRALALDIMVMDFVEAARARGEGLWWIIRREIWPNAAMPLISDFGLRLIFVVIFVAGLSFLGLGVQPPQADWGNMVRENLGALQYDYASKLSVLMPAISIASLTIAINLVVDDLSSYAGGKLAKGM